MELVFIFLVIYLVSVYAAWNYIRIAHSENGRWSNLDLDFDDVIVTVLPGLNTVVSFFWILAPPYTNKQKRDFNKFFNVKKQ